MSTPKYTALVAKVRDWANRDSTILTDSLVSDFIDYSADLCYRELRIPPLEFTYQYTAAAVAGETVLQIPPNLTEIIMFRVTDSSGNSNVFDNKVDIRSFSDMHTVQAQGSFTRKGSNIEFYPASAVGDVFELHYYRRLFDMDATYIVDQSNIDVGNTTIADPIAPTVHAVTVSNVGGNKYFIDTVQQATVGLVEGNTYRFDQSDSTNSGHPLKFSATSNGTHNSGSEYTTGVTVVGTPGNAGSYTQISVPTGAPTLYYYCTAHSGMGGSATTATYAGVVRAEEFPVGSGNYYTGNEVYNWLRDDNERVLLFGALHHAFEYLGDDNQSMKYMQKQSQGILELNRAEQRRRTSGASNRVTYEVSELL
jgi:hypothetical protein